MDIYALGVVCYECLSGHPPFYSGSVEYQIINEPPMPIEDASETVNNTIQTGLNKDSAKRFSSSSAFVIALNGKPGTKGHEKDSSFQSTQEQTQTEPLEEKINRFPPGLIAVPDASYPSIECLAPGSEEAQQLQRQVVQTEDLPLEVVSEKTGMRFH